MPSLHSRRARSNRHWLCSSADFLAEKRALEGKVMLSKAFHAGQLMWRVLSKRKGSLDPLPANLRVVLTNGSQRPALGVEVSVEFLERSLWCSGYQRET